MPGDALTPPEPPPALRNAACIALSATLVALLFWLGSMPFAAGLFPEGWDKVAHSIFYGLLAGLLHIGLGGRRPWLALVLTAAVGVLDELHQGSLPGRSEDFSDWLADVLAAGAVVGLLAWRRGGADGR